MALRIGRWLATVPKLVFSASRRNAREVRSAYGKSIAAQVLEQAYVAYRSSIPPKAYYMFRLYKRENWDQRGDFLHRFETKPMANGRDGIYRVLNAQLAGSPDGLSNKRFLAERCGELGIAAVPTIAWIANGGTLPEEARIRIGCSGDFVSKPSHGGGGRDVERWDRLRGSRFSNVGSGWKGTLEELAQQLEKRAESRELLIQPRLVNHQDLADIGGGALTTTRIQTALAEDLRPEVVSAAYRVPLDNPVVDNIHRGGLAAGVDLESGRLSAASLLRTGARPSSHHPISGTPIAGRYLPDWHEALDLVLRAHAALPLAFFVGWDVGLTTSGPVIVEANVQADVHLLQRANGLPLGRGRFGELMAYHLVRTPLGGG